MAGVVAMASVIEDFDPQPCKKSCKDGGSPVVKTITNYFSPVAKPVEKPFSPPRSNNIMDYFSRKPPSSKEKTSPSPQSKENCQTPQSTEKRTSPEAAVRQQPSQKRGRKATKAARKLVESENACFTATDSCLILDEPHQPKDLAREVISGSGFIGSDTAALLAQLSAEASATARTSEKRATMAVVIDLTEKDEQPKQSPISCHNGKSKAELQCISTSSNVPLREKTNKTATKTSKKRLQEDVKQPEPEEKEAETSLCDVSMEDNEDKASDANNSTVTISFEDFLRSQGQDKGEEGSKITTEAEEMSNDVLKNSSSSAEPSLQVSPRIITVQAEVHTVSPKQELVKDVGKLASIFNKRKGTASPVDVVPSPQTEAGHQSSSSVRSVKRKSNVVLQEEDLELAVLESETTPKCSEAERKQFMAAFKRPSQDGSKTKPGKSQGKQKQPGEKNVDPAENIPEEEDIIPPAVEQVPAASPEKGVTKKKPTRKGKKKAKEENETVTTVVAASPPAEETGVTVIDVDNKEEEPTIPAVRRSRRGADITQPPDTTIASPARKNRKQKESVDDAAAAAAALPDCSENMSTPKTRRSKHGVFVAEMVGPPDMNESPIRIKFTRVNRNVSTSKAGSGSGNNTSKATKTLDNESKRRKKAKKLVEKAKVLQQSKKTAAEKRSPLRRSSRYETSIKKSYCENEDSVICLEDDQSATSLKAPEKSKTRKPLRSLNDVLGKSAVKDTKAVPGSKAATLGPEKGAPKVSTVISIFDDSSREGSENSQDDEQFKARREFLKSGLPESFRKQLAKTTATKEAFSLSSSSFQPVLHIKQLPNDCPLWSLPWPESSLLCPLKDLWSPSSSFSYVSGSFSLKTEPAQRAFCERGSGWRPEISDSVRQLLIEEVSNSNPPFPAQMFITRFLKRRTDHQQHSCTASETAPLAGGKRKRMDDGGENAVKVAKKQRGNHSDENVPKPEPTKRGGRARRGKRFEPEKDISADISAPILCEDESVIVLDDLLVKDTVEKDVKTEDVLWTEKYQPQHSSDIIGNTASVRRLHSWLKEWKLRADREERKNQKDKRREEGNNDSDWDCGEEDSQDAEDMLCNTILITGPTGVGKTAAVYACAQELGFKVFEVNASSQRSGRLILSQLREATQSHQVDSQGVNAHKPTYFNSYGTSSSAGTARPGFSPRKVNSPCRVVSSPRKHPQSPRAGKKGTLAPTALVNFFKMGQPTKKDQQNTKKNEQAAASKKANNESANKKKDVTVKTSARASTPKENSEEQSKKTATSLILFEEVDVIFEEDSGFLAAVKTFMATTKRPVILTTSDPAFSTMFDGSFDEIHFKTPSELNVSTYLQLLCLAEDMRTDPANISSLLRLNGCDIRQSLLQLQFWTRSAGGSSVIKPLKHPDTSAELKPEPVGEAAEMSVCEVTVPHALPPCDTGCTESRLGLLNLEPERDIWKLFRSQSLKETVCWELLINSRQRGVDLLYTNMETLLPLPLTQLTSSICKPVSESKDHPSDIPKEQPSSDILPSHTRLMHMAESGDCSDDGSPIKVSNRMRKNKRRHGLPVQDGLYSDSDSEEGFLSLCKPQISAQDKERLNKRAVPEKVKRKLLTAEARAKSLPVSQCLESMADFFDNMSYLDSLLMHPEGGDVHRRTSAVSAAFKDGMTDELRVEADRESWTSGEQVLQIQAAVEALSFNKCQSSVADAWNKSQQLEGELGKEAAEELTLPVASHREGHSFSQDGPCHRQLVQRRREVMESLILRGAVGLGNRPAAALDYLPVLRTICRSEHLKEKGKVKRRFLHYLDAIHLGLAKSTIQHLAEDFP